MGYNLWLSEDSHSTLSSRMGLPESAPTAEPTPVRRADDPSAPGRADIDRLDS
jgi:hypothetical protein